MALVDTSGHPAARRTVLAGAGLAAGATLLLARGDGVRRGTAARCTPAVHPGPPPGRSLLVRRHPGAGEAGAPPRRRAEVVRVAARPAPGPRPGGRRARLVVPPPEVVAVEGRGRERQRPGRRLGGDAGLPELAPAAPDEQPPSGARDDDGVLGEPLQRAGQRRRRLHLAGALRERDPRPRARLVRVAAAGRQRPPGDGHVPRQRGLRQGPPEREPGPRAARAAHRRAGRALPRAGRRRLGPDPDRLAGRHVGHLGGGSTTRARTTTSRSRSSASTARTTRPTAAR